MAYTVAVYLEKGGSGKTTSTVHFAAAFARAGIETLVADVDGQRHASQWLYPGDPPPVTLNEVVKRPEELSQAIVPSRIPGVSLIYGSRTLPLTAEASLKMFENGDPRDQFSVLHSIVEAVPAQYRVVFIDCSPSVGLLNANALIAADHILVPMDLADLSYQGLQDVAKTLAQLSRGNLLKKKLPKISVLLVRTDSEATKTTDEILGQIVGETQTDRPYNVLRTPIPMRRQMLGIYHTHMTAFDLADSGEFKWSHLRAVADAYAAASKEFASIVVEDMALKAGAA